MANTKEVRKQIASIKSTQKITSAMEMVAASKMKRTQDLMMVGRPYSNKFKKLFRISLLQTQNTHILFMRIGLLKRPALLWFQLIRVCVADSTLIFLNL